MNELVFVVDVICNIAFVVSVFTIISMLFVRYRKPLKRFIDKSKKRNKKVICVINLKPIGEKREEISGSILEEEIGEIIGERLYTFNTMFKQKQNYKYECSFNKNKITVLGKLNEGNYKKGILEG